MKILVTKGTGLMLWKILTKDCSLKYLTFLLNRIHELKCNTRLAATSYFTVEQKLKRNINRRHRSH